MVESPETRSLLVATGVPPEVDGPDRPTDRRVSGRSADVLTIEARVFCERSPNQERAERSRVLCRRLSLSSCTLVSHLWWANDAGPIYKQFETPSRFFSRFMFYVLGGVRAYV